jgi:hypothetical protein
MGREVTCHCKWGAEEADCKVLLETGELILRLGMRRRVAWAEMCAVSARDSKLHFKVGPDLVELNLGPQVAQRWAKVIAAPPPTLAHKLGISSTTKLFVIGDVKSEELKAAIAEGSLAREKDADLILICVNSQLELDRYPAAKTYSKPLWIIYPKGPASGVKESAVRTLLRSQGFIDTKVASVSANLTALRFVSRRPSH